MSELYTCSICGQIHQGAPLSWGPDAPSMWAALEPAEREKRGELGTDQCVIDEKHFFVRGRIEMPVVETRDLFAWLVWVEVSKSDFARMSNLWTVKGREAKEPTYNGLLANELPVYENETFGLAVKLHTRPVGQRPFIEVVAEHRLRDEQKDRISYHRVQEIADKLLNG